MFCVVPLCVSSCLPLLRDEHSSTTLHHVHLKFKLAWSWFFSGSSSLLLGGLWSGECDDVYRGSASRCRGARGWWNVRGVVCWVGAGVNHLPARRVVERRREQTGLFLVLFCPREGT